MAIFQVINVAAGSCSSYHLHYYYYCYCYYSNLDTIIANLLCCQDVI